MEPVIYDDISNADYHKGPGLSASGLKLLARSPAHFKYSLREETPAMKRGTAVHTAVFEPERFFLEYIAAPKIDRRTKDGKTAWAALEDSGKIVLTEAEYADVVGMAAAVKKHSRAGLLVTGGVAERSIAWEYNLVLDDEPTQILLKARPDYIKPISSGCIVIDLKTTMDARAGAFASDAYRRGYHLQAAHYMRGLTSAECETPRSFVFVVVESEKPYGVMVYQAKQDFINRGHEECIRLYELYARCVRDGVWPQYDEAILPLSLPAWAN